MEALNLFWSDNMMTGASSSSVCRQCWAGAYSTVFGISRLGCLGEADRSSARSFIVGNMLALMRVETVLSCCSLGDWGHDSTFHLPAVSTIKQQCPLNTLTGLIIGTCMFTFEFLDYCIIRRISPYVQAHESPSLSPRVCPKVNKSTEQNR